jgi:prephenate dehydrogenase
MQLCVFLKQCGFQVVEMSAEQHDKHVAETLFLTHFIAQVVVRGDFNRTDIDTVSFGGLMDAVESVRHDTELFKDVFRYNPYCKEVLRRFGIAEAEVLKLLEGNNAVQ